MPRSCEQILRDIRWMLDEMSQFINGSMKLFCGPSESDRDCYNRSRTSLLARISAIAAEADTALNADEMVLPAGPWSIWWHGSGPERGDHIMRGREEIAYLPAPTGTDGMHAAAERIVYEHNCEVTRLTALSTPDDYRSGMHAAECYDEHCPGCAPPAPVWKDKNAISEQLMDLRKKHGNPSPDCPFPLSHNLHWDIVEMIANASAPPAPRPTHRHYITRDPYEFLFEAIAPPHDIAMAVYRNCQYPKLVYATSLAEFQKKFTPLPPPPEEPSE